MYYIILYYFILYYIILYYIELYYIYVYYIYNTCFIFFGLRFSCAGAMSSHLHILDHCADPRRPPPFMEEILCLGGNKKNRGRWTYGESMVIHVKSRKFWKMQKQLKHWRHIESSSRHSQSGINHEIPSRTMALEADVHRNLMKTQSLKTELVASESFSGLDLLTRTCFIPTCWIHDSGKLLERFLFICLTLFWLLY